MSTKQVKWKGQRDNNGLPWTKCNCHICGHFVSKKGNCNVTCTSDGWKLVKPICIDCLEREKQKSNNKIMYNLLMGWFFVSFLYIAFNFLR